MESQQDKFYFTLFVDKETEAEQVMTLGLEPRTPPSQFSILPKLVATVLASPPRPFPSLRTSAQPQMSTPVLVGFLSCFCC